jgi:hypothetical protein
MGVWDPATRYVTDDIVSARGSTWIAKRNNRNRVPGQTAPSTADDWQLFARGFNPLGAWSNAIRYQPDDLVTHLGQTYRAKITNTNKLPTNTNNWELLVAKGANGATGATGPTGPAGPAGPNTGIAAGSAGGPAISFVNDANTGIYSPGEGKIALVADGIAFLRNLDGQNTALGLAALANNPTGGGNTAVGSNALQFNTAGFNNTALGLFSLGSNVTGSTNTAVGQNALYANSAGTDNTAVGGGALAANSTGLHNTAVGVSALASNTGGEGMVAVGYNALGSLPGQDGGASNFSTALGYSALALATAPGNTGLGGYALGANTTGQKNLAAGTFSLQYNSAGSDNVAVGYEALQSNQNSGNTAIGSSALVATITGGNNTAVGRLALAANQIGDNNIAVGANAGRNPINASNSIFIGNEGQLVDTATIKIGTQTVQTSAFIAGIHGATSTGGIGVLVNSDGQLGTATSSRRYKDEIETLADVGSLLTQLRPVTFHYKQAEADGSKPKQYGLIAEEVEAVVPDLAAYNKDGTVETVKYHFLPPLLLAGHQAQQKTVEALQTTIKTQADKIEAQAKEMAGLKQRLANIEAMLSRTTKASLQ